MVGAKLRREGIPDSEDSEALGNGQDCLKLYLLACRCSICCSGLRDHEIPGFRDILNILRNTNGPKWSTAEEFISYGRIQMAAA